MAAALVLVVSACSTSAETADGVVIDIDTEGLGQMRSFTLRTSDGESLDFVIAGGVDLSGDGFPPDHLFQHMALTEGIAVAYEMRDGERVVTKLADAPWLDR